MAINLITDSEELPSWDSYKLPRYISEAPLFPFSEEEAELLVSGALTAALNGAPLTIDGGVLYERKGELGTAPFDAPQLVHAVQGSSQELILRLTVRVPAGDFAEPLLSHQSRLIAAKEAAVIAEREALDGQIAALVERRRSLG